MSGERSLSTDISFWNDLILTLIKSFPVWGSELTKASPLFKESFSASVKFMEDEASIKKRKLLAAHGLFPLPAVSKKIQFIFIFLWVAKNEMRLEERFK